MKFKRILATALASTFVLSSSVFAADINTPFSDVDTSSEQGKAIVKMYEKGYLKGYEDGTFKPNGNITRAELTRVFNLVFGYSLNEENAKDMKDFTDNFDTTAWYYNDVRIAQSNKYINGFDDGSFKPKANFTREQACTVIYLVAKLQDKDSDVNISDSVSAWAEKYVKANIDNGVFALEDNNTFRATANITRGEVCLALSKFVKDTDTTIDTTVTESTTETTSATVTESTTETTTKKSSSGGGGGGSSSGGGGGSSSGGSSSSTTTETTTEATTKDPSDIKLTDDEISALERVIKATKNELIPSLYSTAQRSIANFVLNTLETYRDNPSYNFTGDIAEAKTMYKNLEESEKNYLQSAVLASYDTSDLNMLLNIFEPYI